MCGSAADFAIRACTPTDAENAQRSTKVGCLAFALCCHHLCEMDVICGRQVLVDHGVTTVVNYRISSRALHTILIPSLFFELGGLCDYEEARDILPVSNMCSAPAQRTGNI
jgi:hypothetical protein